MFFNLRIRTIKFIALLYGAELLITLQLSSYQGTTKRENIKYKY